MKRPGYTMIKKSNIEKLYYPIPTNSFDFIRLGLASIVVLAHFIVLTGIEERPLWAKIFTTHLAVKGFFILSGYLILSSYLKTPDIKTYLVKRAKRLLPAYCSIILLSTFFLGLLSNLNYLDYITHPQVWKYFFSNLFFLNFLEPSLPGVFLNNPVKEIVNGSLWTLKIEISFYLFVPFLVYIFRKLNNKKAIYFSIIILYLLGYFFRVLILKYSNSYPFLESLINQLPGSIQYFCVGMGFYLFVDSKHFKNPIILLLGCLMLLEKQLFNTTLLWPIGLGIIIMYIGFTFKNLANCLNGNDYSYGVYIFHFPILQTLISVQVLSLPYWLVFLLYILTVSILAFLSWNQIEKPFLRRKK
ncbi:MAG TPA: acyltransferase [Edaphocola sp.]|nr:acyltransferase [Edaphocola sp.]